MNLNNWIELARKSWKENNPSLYRQLLESGKLEEALNEAAEKTYRDVCDLEESGYSPDEAWIMAREIYILIKPEEEEDEITSKGAALFNESNALLTKILREL
jgi:hypothetical protein